MLSYLYFIDKKAEAQGGSLVTCAGFEPKESGLRIQNHCTALPLYVPPRLPSHTHTHTHTHTLTPFSGPALQLSHFAQREQSGLGRRAASSLGTSPAYHPPRPHGSKCLPEGMGHPAREGGDPGPQRPWHSGTSLGVKKRK